VLILSGYANEEYVLRALRCGAAGYMLKEAAAEELGLAIKSVAQGKTYLSPSVSRTVVESYLQRAAGEEGPIEQLTARQREVLQLIAEGKNTKEIAHLLGVSIKTVEAHRAQLMDRVGIHDVAGLVRYAIRTGLISAEK
jgi:DNA-binding NarL/FixJ family response regulator